MRIWKPVLARSQDPVPTLHLSTLFNCSHLPSADRPDDGGGPGRGIRNIRLERALHFSGGAVWKISLAFGGQAPWNNLNLAKKPGQRDLPVFYVTYMIFEKSILTIGAEIFSVRSPNPLAPGSDIQIHIIWGTNTFSETDSFSLIILFVLWIKIPKYMNVFLRSPHCFQHSCFNLFLTVVF